MEETTIGDEVVELEFKRFSQDKQDQVRALVNYATLMGLDGKDLVSIGSKLNRIKEKGERIRRLDIIRSYTLEPVGDDKALKGINLERAMYKKFALSTANGVFTFENNYGRFRVKSRTTGKTKNFSPSYVDLGRINWDERERAYMLWAIYSQEILLNF